MEEQTETNKGTHKDPIDRQFGLAVVFIGGFFFFLGASLVYYFLSSDSEILKWLTSVFSGWVGTIIGFYFGQRPVQQMRETLREERKRSEELTNYIKEKTDQMWKKLEASPTQ